jgi:hypothetical protein
MNMVTPLTHSVDREQILRLFSEFKIRYQHAWTSLADSDHEWQLTLDVWFQELRNFSSGQLFKAKTDAFLIYTKFPPKIGELVDLCLKASGVPDVSDVIRMMIDRNIDHPIAKMVYDNIGSWKLRNGTEKEIRDQASIAYQQALIDFKENPKGQRQRLQDFQEMKLKQLPPPEKLPTPGESQAFRDFMTKCREILGVTRSPEEKEHYREFDEEKITQTNRNFEQRIYNEFCDYLLSIPEERTHILPPRYVFRRMKLIAAKEQPKFLREKGYPNPQGHAKDAPRGHGGPQRVYKSFYGE